MKNNYHRTKDIRMINLIDLLIEVLLHWRGLIIATIVCGVILGSYGYLNLRKQRIAESQAVVQTESQLQYDRDETLNILYSRLSAKDISGINVMLDDLDQVQRWEKYFESSVLMKADPFNMPEGSVVLKVEAESEIISDIYDAYSSALPSFDMFEALKEKLGWEDNINEQIILWNAGSIDEDHFMKEYRFYALSEEDCVKLQDAFIEYALLKSTEYESAIGTNTITVSDRNVTVIYDSSINDKQKAAHTNKTTLENVITNTYDVLSPEGKSYYDLYTGRIESVDLSAPQLIDESEEESKAEPKDTKMMIIYGLLGGFFGYALIVAIIYIFSNKLRDTDNFSVTYGINQLGRVFRPSKNKKFSTAIDRAIYSLKRRGRQRVSYEEAIENAALSTALAAEKTGIKKMGIYCADKDDVLAPRIADLLKEKGISSVTLYCPFKLEQAAHELTDVDSAIIIAKSGISRYYDVWDIIEMTESQNVNLIGGIMA